MAEDLTDYMHDVGIRVKYLHSDIDTLERSEIIRDMPIIFCGGKAEPKIY